MHDTVARLAERLIETLPQIAAATKHHAERFVTPVGDSCEQIAQFKGTPAESVITEPEAEVIRSKSSAEVQPMAEYVASLVKAVNVDTGHCVLVVDGIGQVTGKISDPVLQTPENVYTSALNKQTGLALDAKAITKEGVVTKLFISDAKGR